MNNVAVMYHYVREPDHWNGIVPLSPKHFEDQIDYISRTHNIISVNDIRRKHTKPWCVLTFDDGTKDQYTFAFDILKRKGISAYFTVMSGPAISQDIPLVHLVHSVLSFISDEEMWERINNKFDTRGVEGESQIYSYEKNILRRYNKYMLNFKLSETEVGMFLKDIFNIHFLSKEEFIKDFYLNAAEIKEMHNAGMEIGIHGNRHLPYNLDPQTFYREEIDTCKKWLYSIGIEPRWYTPPFGGGKNFHDMRNQLTSILISNGINGAFTTQKGFISDNQDFWMNRIDCNQIKQLI
ncbi:polysaccharide deacetylase family protein [Paenibacillus sp. CFBP 13594]|nr:polysaccharide deacetylase family protein [Paenibacillus sp. CFBP 13594]MBD8840707.1 polysaccharide deacetylase family protein [Paenibacillus sp. CFBP 13594]QZN76537.1 polysaccharide deacetylase family protein [Paenibacillus sp. DR312]